MIEGQYKNILDYPYKNIKIKKNKLFNFIIMLYIYIYIYIKLGVFYD